MTDRVIAPPPHCDECGFEAETGGAPEMAARLQARVAAYGPLLTSADTRVRERPDEKTWSPLEYGAHMRDVVAIWNWGMKQALTQDRPQFAVPDPDTADQAAVAGNYAALDPAAVSTELEANAARMADRIRSLDHAQWSRVILFGEEELTVLDIANKVLHETQHHLQDIERSS